MIEIIVTIILCIIIIGVILAFGFIALIIFLIILVIGWIFLGGINLVQFIFGGDKSLSEKEKINEREQPTYQPNQTNVCDTGPKNALNGLTCRDIESKSLGNYNSGLNVMMNNDQNIFMRQRNINFNELGHKFKGEVCWSNEIQNCVSKNCLEKNRNNKDIAICKIKENILENKAFTFFDPGNVNLIKKYNLTENDFK
jgi:hypothetical protein